MGKKLCALAVALTIAAFSLITAWAGNDNAAASKTQESTLNWSQFLGNEGLQGVSDAKTPRTAAELELKWKVQTGTGWNDVPGTPIVVGNNVYCYSSQYLRKYDLITGEELAKAQVFGKSTNQFFINLCYGDGKIFVPVKTNNMEDGTEITKSHLRVFDADTLEQLYITEDVTSGDMQTPVMYHDGYVVFGGYFRNSYYACFSTKDEDTASSNEVKKAIWSVQSTNTKGFCWNGAAFVGDCVYFADNGYRDSSTVWTVKYKTGEIVDTFKMPDGYDSKSTIIYNDRNNRLYIPAVNSDNSASIRSYEVNADGTLNQETVKEWKSGTSGGGTQSTPVIYNNRLYIAGGGGTMSSGEPFHVVDADTMQEIYKIDGLISKGSPVISTAYATEENGDQVYIYMVPYDCTKESNFWIISDKEGQTEPIYETTTVGSNYCSQTVAIASNGYLVWYQDDKYLYVCGRKDSETASAITGEDVNAQIARQADPVDFGYYNKVEITRIEERYNALSDAEKTKVTEYGKLLEIKKVMQFDGTNAIERLNDGIAALPESVTLESKETVQTLFNVYNKLSDADKAKVIDADKLIAADNTIKRLETEQEIAALKQEIEALPAVHKLTSADGGTVKKLVSRYQALDEDGRKKADASGALLAAEARIAAIEKQMSDVQALIKEKLEGQKVTLDSAADLKAIDQAMEGVAPSDVALITGVEQYLSPAKADLVNLMTEKLIGLTVTKTNLKETKALLEDISYFYQGILEADIKYVKNYEQVAVIQKAVETVEADIPKSGVELPFGIIGILMLAGAVTMVTVKRRTAR